MIKADLARLVYERHGGVSYREAKQMVERVIGKVKGRLVAGETVKLTGFGSFNVHTRRQRTGRNPQTGRALTLKARKSVSFKPSKHIKFNS
jgi:integration host factor subunit alpha